jgi:transposase-like protein
MPVRGLDTLTNNGPAHVLVWVMKLISYARHRFPSDIIRHAVWLYLRFTLSYRDVEDLLAERGLMVSNESIRRWVLKFGPTICKELTGKSGPNLTLVGISTKWWSQSLGTK